MIKIKSLFRRGHTGPSGGKRQNRPDDFGGHLGASAVPNNNEPPMRPAASVSSLDSKHYKIGSLPPQPQKWLKPALNADSNSKKMDVEFMKTEFDTMVQEKANLEARVQELIRCHGEVETLRMEIARLKEKKIEAEQILLDNMLVPPPPIIPSPSPPPPLPPNPPPLPLHNELDNQMLDDDNTSLPTNVSELPESNDWDKHSTSSLSEVSVACLQDRIMQMEETHHSTNEELQATLQELADLQTQLSELQTDNERLGEEKGVLLESLCRQTERLEDARTKVDTLQGLLLDSSPGCPASNSEREQKLVELLKSGQDERETLLLKQEELSNELSEQRRTCEVLRQESSRLNERVELLESTIDATHAERNQLDLQLAQAKEESSSRQIEISRLNTLLDNARAKIEELEASRGKMHDRSEMDELLRNARKEKDVLEGQAASLQEQLSRSRCEVARLKEQISVLQEECKVTRNNAKSALSDLEYECQRNREECARLATDLQALQETSSELQVQTQCHLDDKRQLQSVLTETQKHLGECARTLASTEKQLADEKRLRNRENEEWEQFQSDLLMTVRVANEFKTEAQHELEKLVMENKLLRDNIRNLDAQIEKLKQAAEKQEMVMPENNSTTGPCVQEMCRRHKISRQERDSRLSVKSLIESIENATKQAKAGPGGSRSSSTSSLNSIASLTSMAVNQNISTSQQTGSSPTSPIREGEMKPPLPLRDRDQQLTTTKQPLKWTLLPDPLEPVKGNNKVSTISEDTTTSILNSRSIEFARKNSSGDLCERKDPLSALSKNGGSKRNALLKWCQSKTLGYKGIDITNFSSSWNDGLALCAILHSYLPDRVPYETLSPSEKRRNFTIAFAAAESVGIPTALSISDMILQERPDWQQVMAYVTAVYKHFET